MRAPNLANRFFIRFLCAAFSVLILYGVARIYYRNGSAVTVQGAVARVGNPWTITGVGAFNRDGNPNLPRRNPVTGQALIGYMKGALLLNTASLESFTPAWKIIDVNDFDPAGSPDILWNYSITGNIAVLHMRGPVHQGSDTLAARAPPPITLEGRHFYGDVLPHIDWRPIVTLPVACPLFPEGAPCSIIFYSLYIRASPMPLLYSC